MLRAAVLAAVGSFPCSAGCSREPADPVASTAGLTRAPERGDLVVVERVAASFFQGRVLERRDGTLRVQNLVDRSTSQVSVADAYLWPVASGRWSIGDHAIAQVRHEVWEGCRVEALAGEEAQVHLSDGRVVPVPLGKLLRPSALTELNIRRRLERAERDQDFAQAVRRAGAPRAPNGWQPMAHERVIARAGSVWFSARVDSALEEGVAIRWDSDRRRAVLAPSDVVPQTIGAVGLERGRFALLRPASPAEPWAAVRVLAVAPPEVTIVGGDSARRVVQARDLIALE